MLAPHKGRVFILKNQAKISHCSLLITVSPVLINNINSSIAFVLLPHYHLVSFHQSYAEINLWLNQIKCTVNSLHHFPSLVPEQGLFNAYWIFTSWYPQHNAVYCSYTESPSLMRLLACRRERFINNYTIRMHPQALPFTVFTNSFSMLFFIIYLEIKTRLYCVMFNILQENIYSLSCLSNCHSQIAFKMQSKVTCSPESHYMLW